MQTRAPDLVAGAALAALAAVILSQTVGQGFGGRELARNPMWLPRLLAGLLAAASAALVLRALIGKGDTPPAPNVRRLASAGALVAAYMAAFAWFGYLGPSLIVIPALSWSLGYRRAGVCVAVSVGFVVGVWYLFAHVFVMRPPGPGVDAILAVVTGR